MIDLSMLDVFSSAANGKPLELPLVDIDEDPEQPRKEFSKDAMTDMVASIRATGVRTPVSVRPHPKDAGRYMLNYGARRYRASLAAGRKTIPAFLDEQHSDYDQVIENEQRENLKPMELAMFIKRKLAEGDKPAEIARRLGKPKPVITYHQALIDAPALIERVYSSGRCTSPRTLYELRNLYEKHPRKVDAWAEAEPEISRASIAELAERLEQAQARSRSTSTAGDATGGMSSSDDGASTPTTTAPLVSGRAGTRNTTTQSGHAGPPNSSSDDWIDDPVVAVKFEGRAATILLDRHPSQDGRVHLRFEDRSEAEVPCCECIITRIYDAADSLSPIK